MTTFAKANENFEEKKGDITMGRGSLEAVDKAVQELEAYIQPDGATNIATIMNLMKNLTGSTVLVLPILMAQASILNGMLLLVLYGFMFGFTFWLIGECCEQTGVYSYRDIWRVSLGKSTAWVVDLCQGMYGMISSICYVVCIGDYVQRGCAIVDNTLFVSQEDNKKWIMIGASVFPLLPLCLLKNLGPLKYTSMAGVGIILVIFIYTYTLFFSNWDYGETVANDSKINFNAGAAFLDANIFKAVGHAAAAYGVHMNSARFYKELKIRTPENFAKLTFVSFFGSFCFKAPFAIAAFCLFGSLTDANVLTNFKIWPGVTVMALWVSMSLCLIFTFPLMFSAAREAFFGVCDAFDLGRYGLKPKGASRVAMTIGLLSFITFVAVVAGKLENLSRIKGHILANLICLLFPPIIYLNLGSVSEEMPLSHNGRVVKKQWCVTCCYIMIGLSFFAVPLGIYNCVI